MACSHPIVDYVSTDNNGGCCETAQSLCDWLSVHTQGWLTFGGCYGLGKSLNAGQVSIHATGRAIDVNVLRYRVGSPQNKAAAFMLDTYVTPNACTLGIQRMVFEGRMWTSGMETSVKHADWPTVPSTMLHTTALHIEITPDLCGTFRYQDVNAVMVLTSSAVFVGGKEGDPLNPRVETLAPSVTGNGTDGTAIGGGVTGPSAHGTAENSPTTTAPVWSSTVWELGACAACGTNFSGLLNSEVIQQTHCGGTGAICINKTNGQTCSTGTAPDIGDFPGAIRDFIWWGNGGYGLSKNGMTVYALGEAIDPVFELGTPEEVGPWEKIIGVGPSTIAVSKTTAFGVRSLQATVNSIADYTCCEPAVDAEQSTLSTPFVLYNFALDGGEVLMNNRGTKGTIFNATEYPIEPSCEPQSWMNDHTDTPSGPQLPTIFSTMTDFDGNWCASGIALIATVPDVNFYAKGDWFVYGDTWNGFEITFQIEVQTDGTGFIYLLLRDSVYGFSATGSLYLSVDLSPTLLSSPQNTIVLNFIPSADDVIDSMVAYVNGQYVDDTLLTKTVTPVTCTQLSGQPDGEYPAPYASTLIEGWYMGGSPCDTPITSGGVALARGWPNRAALDYWQEYDWTTHEGFAP